MCKIKWQIYLQYSFRNFFSKFGKFNHLKNFHRFNHKILRTKIHNFMNYITNQLKKAMSIHINS